METKELLFYIAGLLMLFLICAFGTFGCAGTLDKAVMTMNGAAEQGEIAIGLIEDDYREELFAVVDGPGTKEEKGVAIQKVKKKYAPAFSTYRAFRATWLAAAEAIEAGQMAEAAGDEPDTATITVLLIQLLDTVRELEKMIRTFTAQSNE